MKLTENFYLSEFRSKDGSDFTPAVTENLRTLAANLQVLRDHIGRPITINSGYRAPAHNARVGGSPNSMHLTGKAADIRVRGMDPADVAATIEALIRDGKMKEGGLGAYSTFVHYDIRGIRARW